MSIKKTFVPMIDMLTAAVAAGTMDQSVLDDAITLASPKRKSASGEPRELTFLKDSAGEVVAIMDYYFKRWMPLVGSEAVEFGAKKSSTTGLNSMCKEGLSHWNKQQSAAKKALEQILVDVESGDLEPGDIADRKAEIEAERKAIADTTLGFATKDELLDYLADNGVELEEADAE